MSLGQFWRVYRMEKTLTRHVTRPQWWRLLKIVDAAMSQAFAQLSLPADQQARIREQVFFQWRERTEKLPLLISDKHMNETLGRLIHALHTLVQPELGEPQFRLFVEILSEQFAQRLRTTGDTL